MMDSAMGVKIYNEEEQIENSPRFRHNTSPRKIFQSPNTNNINIIKKTAKITGCVSLIGAITIIILICTFFALSNKVDPDFFKDILIAFCSVLFTSLLFSCTSLYFYTKYQNYKNT